MTGYLRISGLCFSLAVIVSLLGFLIPRLAPKATAQVTCPCDFDVIPKTIDCWPIIGTTHNATWFPENMSTDCSLGGQETSGFVNDTAGTCFMRGFNTNTCDFAVNESGLTAEEVEACQCALQEYATELNDMVGITAVLPGPPYECTTPPLLCGLLPQFINLSPTTATNDVRTDHTVTATVDTDGTPESGVLVTFEITSGPNTGQVSDPNTGECSVNTDCTTDGNGEVSWTYTSNGTPGTDTIVSTFTDLAASTIESNIVEKIWVIPPTTGCCQTPAIDPQSCNTGVIESTCLDGGGAWTEGSQTCNSSNQCADEPGTGCCVLPVNGATAETNTKTIDPEKCIVITEAECSSLMGDYKGDGTTPEEFPEECSFPPLPTRNIPTISQWGLIAMAGILGIIGFIMVIRRRKVTA